MAGVCHEQGCAFWKIWFFFNSFYFYVPEYRSASLRVLSHFYPRQKQDKAPGNLNNQYEGRSAMNRNRILGMLFLSFFVLMFLPSIAYTAEEAVYGWELMTNEERVEFHDKMRAAKTPEERMEIRKEHHAKMELRAKEQGVVLKGDPSRMGGQRKMMMDKRGGGSGMRKGR